MDNQDKIINKIKSAAHKAEHQNFSGMEKVWGRIDEKLEQNALETKTKTWKKIAIAASVLLVVSLGYQLIKPTKSTPNTNEVVVQKDSVETRISKPIEKVVTSTQIDTTKINTVLKETESVVHSKTRKGKIAAPNSVALQEVTITADEKEIQTDKIVHRKEMLSKSKSSFNRGRIYDAVEVESAFVARKSVVQDSVVETIAVAKNAPLVVMNGKLVSSPKYSTAQEAKKEILSNLDNEEIDSLIILKEPLYIINGVEYSEESLFGKTPTSPYAPLAKQNIVTFEILQNEEATEKYGNKGKKGVVIITTKNGIPLKK